MTPSEKSLDSDSKLFEVTGASIYFPVMFAGFALSALNFNLLSAARVRVPLGRLQRLVLRQVSDKSTAKYCSPVAGIWSPCISDRPRSDDEVALHDKRVALVTGQKTVFPSSCGRATSTMGERLLKNLKNSLRK